MNLERLRDELARAGRPDRPRLEPKGLQEVIFIGARGDQHRAWMERRRTVEIKTNQKIKVNGQESEKAIHVELADLCIELRPGKFTSIEGVPWFGQREGAEFFSAARWATRKMLAAQSDYDRMVSETSRAADTDNLGLKGL